MIKQRWPEATHNYRTGLNVHVRVPGLSSDLKKLKQLQAFVHRVMPELLPIIDPIPEPARFPTSGEKKCHKTRLKDHHMLLNPERLELQLAARTITEFFEAEAVHLETGRIHWALHARTCVNLRQMLQTDTIEFRHFFMPNNAVELLNATLWCRMFLEAAFDGSSVPAKNLLDNFGFNDGEILWPRPLPYDPWLDEGWHFTSPHEIDREEVPARIERWLADQKETIDARNNGLKKQALPKRRA
jgi:hypothetical protein